MIKNFQKINKFTRKIQKLKKFSKIIDKNSKFEIYKHCEKTNNFLNFNINFSKLISIITMDKSIKNPLARTRWQMKTKKAPLWCFFGAPRAARTPNLQFRRPKE